jgi:hypothetical protein
MTSTKQKNENNDEISDYTYSKQSGTIEDYINRIHMNCEKSIPMVKKLHKVSDDNITLPTTDTYSLLIENNYNVSQLKQFAKSYKLKLAGNKKQLVTRLYTFLYLSSIIQKIQKVFRGRLQRKYNFLHGPAFIKREMCTNGEDFLTGDEIKTISYSQFFSYKDVDDFIYGFDIISLYNLIAKSGKQVKNPYNRNIISAEVIKNMRQMIRLSRILKIKIDIDIKDVEQDITPQKSVELRALDLFQNIDALGNYSNPDWFLSLTRSRLIKFIRELVDIWEYRAQLSIETKRAICPPNGRPFSNINLSNLVSNEQSMDVIKKNILDVLEKFVNSGIDKDSKSLGAYYVLGALTIVNENAATSLPWLFQSVSYF